MKKAILIGAGFSYDLGMPLAKSLTEDFFYYLNPERMKKFVELWKKADPYGKERPIDPISMDIVHDIYLKYFRNKECNYEDFLKEIQNRHRSEHSQKCKDGLHYAFGKFFDIIYQMFWMYHVNNIALYQVNKKFYKWLVDYAEKEELWVLSLNHDLFIESLCLENNIPLSFGATEDVRFPQSNVNLDPFINFQMTSRENMKLTKMDFFIDRPGVNLIKLHGALNEFSIYNDKSIVHLSPNYSENMVSYLERVSNVLFEPHYYIDGQPVLLGSEFAISDLEGEMQFLRKSMLTGGYKYSETFDPKPGEEKMSLLEEVLSLVDELTIVGYGFADSHINFRLYNAMLLNKNLSITIVDPYITDTPEILKPFNYKMRVRKIRSGMPEWVQYNKNGKWDSELLQELNELRLVRNKLGDDYKEQYLK